MKYFVFDSFKILNLKIFFKGKKFVIPLKKVRKWSFHYSKFKYECACSVMLTILDSWFIYATFIVKLFRSCHRNILTVCVFFVMWHMVGRFFFITCSSLMATQELDGNPWSIGTKNCRHPLQCPIKSIIQIRLNIRINTEAMLRNCELNCWRIFGKYLKLCFDIARNIKFIWRKIKNIFSLNVQFFLNFDQQFLINLN